MARLVGTGKDPENRYPEGIVFDAPEALEGRDEPGAIGYPGSAQDLIDKGFAERQDPEEDHGRQVSSVAAAAVRGDALTDPVEAKIAEDDLLDGTGRPTHEAYDIVHEEEGSVQAPVDGEHPSGDGGDADDDDGIDATDGARSKADELGVDLSEVDGTGSNGRITQDDVERHASA